MTKAVIFDLDGLLIDSEPVFYHIFQEIVGEYGYEFSLETYARCYSGKTSAQNITNLIGSHGLPLTVEEGLAKEDEIEKRLTAQGVALKKGAKELLAYLKDHGYRIAVASSSTAERAWMILRQHGVDGYFEESVFAHEVTKGKPDPEAFLKASGKLGMKPEECLVLEDSEAGIQAAYAATIPVICIPDMKKPSLQYLDKTAAVLDSLTDVIGYLEHEGETT